MIDFGRFTTAFSSKHPTINWATSERQWERKLISSFWHKWNDHIPVRFDKTHSDSLRRCKCSDCSNLEKAWKSWWSPHMDKARSSLAPHTMLPIHRSTGVKTWPHTEVNNQSTNSTICDTLTMYVCICIWRDGDRDRESTNLTIWQHIVYSIYLRMKALFQATSLLPLFQRYNSNE